MTITTKYNIGETVYYMYDNKICTMVIGGITIVYKSRKKGEWIANEVAYSAKQEIDGVYTESRYERVLFPTKQALLESL